MFTQDQLGLDDAGRYAEIERDHGRAAEELLALGDKPAHGLARMWEAWAMEKQGRLEEALRVAEEARTVLGQAEDLALVASCGQSIGVWKFHGLDADADVRDFEESIELRLRADNLVAAAQSWHNMAYVQLSSGKWSDARTSYREAAGLLVRVQAGPDAGLAASADRGKAFVLSHLAYASARQQPVAETLTATASYFEHVARTGAHREPVMAYLAPGIALALGEGVPTAESDALVSLTGIPADAESWLRKALDVASEGLAAGASTGRRAYLGAHVLALVELARWFRSAGREDEADQHVERARLLATARGWQGEAKRAVRFGALTAGR